MWTGTQTLQSINQTLDTVNNDVERLDRLLNELSQSQAANQSEQSQVFQRLALLRLQALQAEPLQNQLSHADSMALSALNKRKEALESLEKRIQDLQLSITKKEDDREQEAQRMKEYAQKLIDCERQAQSELESDAEFLAQFAISETADAIADRAESKTQTANEDRVQKGKPFEADPLFMYLWNRHYGQAEYKAGLISRMLDKWVARLCSFEKVRVNYWMLLELPKRLALHAESVRHKADDELQTLEAIERRIAEKNGVLAAQAELDQQTQRVDNHDDQIQIMENEYDHLLHERNQFSTGEDAGFKEAIHIISAALQRKEIYALQSMTEKTAQREDDQLVDTLFDLRQEASELKSNINENRQRQQRYLDKLNELKQVRHQFKRKRFDDVRSGFENGGLIGIALNEFLRGVLSNGELWRVIERSQRHRDVGAWPDFGSGGLGHGGAGNNRNRRRRGGSTWHWPGGSRSSGGGFRLPRSGGSSRGRGGFRTGGGF